MFDLSNLEVDKIVGPVGHDRYFAVYYAYKNKRGLTYVLTEDELGAYQGLLEQLEERYGNE